VRVRIDKAHVLTLVGIVALTAIVVGFLSTIREPTMVQVSVKCEQINFALTVRTEVRRALSFMNSPFWIRHAKLVKFGKIMFGAPPSLPALHLAHYRDETEITISPVSADSYVEIVSQVEAFSLRDVFVERDVSVSWGLVGDSYRVLIGNINEEGEGQISIDFSTGDSLRLQLFDCVFLDRNGAELHRTGRQSVEQVDIPISKVRPQAIVIANPGGIEMRLRPQVESFAEGIDLLSELAVDKVDFLKEERLSENTGLRDRNTILEGRVRLPEYAPNDSVGIQKGDYIRPLPKRGLLKQLKLDSSSVNVLLEYNARSLMVGPHESSGHELVRSTLEKILDNRILVVIYTVSMAIFYFVVHFIIKRKQ